MFKIFHFSQTGKLPDLCTVRYMYQTITEGGGEGGGFILLGLWCLTWLSLFLIPFLCVEVWQLELMEGEEEEDEFTGVLVSDLVLYLDHEDPGLRGQAAKLVCKVGIFSLNVWYSPSTFFFLAFNCCLYFASLSCRRKKKSCSVFIIFLFVSTALNISCVWGLYS